MSESAIVSKTGRIIKLFGLEYPNEIISCARKLVEMEKSSQDNESDRLGDQRARTKIGIIVKNQCLTHIKTASTTKRTRKCWKMQDKGVKNRYRLLRKLVNQRLEF